MPQHSDLTSSATLPPPTRVHILGAGPVGGSVASIAVEALVVRDRISESDFKALYRPFELLIPIAELDGHAPSTPG